IFVDTAIYVLGLTGILRCDAAIYAWGFIRIIRLRRLCDALHDHFTAYRIGIKLFLVIAITFQHRGQLWDLRLGYIGAYDPDHDIEWHHLERARLMLEAFDEGGRDGLLEFHDDERRIQEELAEEEAELQEEGFNYQRLTERERGQSEHYHRILFARERSAYRSRQEVLRRIHRINRWRQAIFGTATGEPIRRSLPQYPSLHNILRAQSLLQGPVIQDSAASTEID
ncbi:MAG: hypothetical protein Q9174_007307, partial [Haloplaca sp. 1 TL-2023]